MSNNFTTLIGSDEKRFIGLYNYFALCKYHFFGITKIELKLLPKFIFYIRFRWIYYFFVGAMLCEIAVGTEEFSDGKFLSGKMTTSVICRMYFNIYYTMTYYGC